MMSNGRYWDVLYAFHVLAAHTSPSTRKAGEAYRCQIRKRNAAEEARGGGAA
jgi:hypothetical protein